MDKQSMDAHNALGTMLQFYSGVLKQCGDAEQELQVQVRALGEQVARLTKEVLALRAVCGAVEDTLSEVRRRHEEQEAFVREKHREARVLLSRLKDKLAVGTLDTTEEGLAMLLQMFDG